MKKTFAAVVTSLALIAAPAGAQAPAAVDPAAAAAVQDLLAAMRIRDTMSATMQQMVKTIPQDMRAMISANLNSNPALSAEEKKAALEQAEKTIPATAAAISNMLSDPTLMDEMIAEMAPIYTRHYSVGEIRELTAFYRTPLGQKMLKTMPAVMTESMQINNRLMGPRLNKLMEQVMQSVKQ